MKNNKSGEPDYDYVAFIAQRTVSLMSRLRIPQTPENYSTWFNYSQGNTPKLKRAIDALFDKEGDFDASARAAIIADIGVEMAAAVPNDIPERLGSVIEDARGLLQIAIEDNRKQMLTMGGAANEAAAAADPVALVESLVVELSKSVSRASRLERNFAEASQELSAIRVSLDEAEKRAKTDGLTGLANRSAFEDFFRNAQTAVLKNGSPLSVLLIDVDHFKRFNDDFGHGVGDEVLRLIAKVLRERVRDQDLPARYGGEELIAAFPDSDLKACAAVAESIRRSISDCKITRRSTGQALPGITVSIGVAQLRPGEPMADLIERCDQALYKAKDAGRNRVFTDVECDPGMRNQLAAAGGL
jgi:diguanylate cyclase